MTGKVREHSTDNITVTYDVRRCIHASECVHGLPEVFDPKRRPWIEPGKVEPDAVADVVRRCPTGALQFRRLDGGEQEPAPHRNVLAVSTDGPLYLSGDVEIAGTDGPVREFRVALCRCGASTHKPYCDGHHLDASFTDDGTVDTSRALETASPEPHGKLEITPRPGGPLLLSGVVEIVSADGRAHAEFRKTALCRCGRSKNKPFCDGAHKENVDLEG